MKVKIEFLLVAFTIPSIVVSGTESEEERKLMERFAEFMKSSEIAEEFKEPPETKNVIPEVASNSVSDPNSGLIEEQEELGKSAEVESNDISEKTKQDISQKMESSKKNLRVEDTIDREFADFLKSQSQYKEIGSDYGSGERN